MSNGSAKNVCPNATKISYISMCAGWSLFRLFLNHITNSRRIFKEARCHGVLRVMKPLLNQSLFNFFLFFSSICLNVKRRWLVKRQWQKTATLLFLDFRSVFTEEIGFQRGIAFNWNFSWELKTIWQERRDSICCRPSAFNWGLHCICNALVTAIRI